MTISQGAVPPSRFGVAQAAFTLTDLISVIATVAVLGALLIPTLAAPRQTGSGVVCLNNVRQLIVAWQMYATENNGRLIMGFHGGDAQGGSISRTPSAAPWAVGWLDWGTSPDNTNTLFLTDSRYSKLSPYLGHSAELFHCPDDRYVSAAQRARGWSHRTRSYSMNLCVGEGNALTGPFEPIYKQIRKMSEFIHPGPSENYIFVEEHPDSMNDPGLFNPRRNGWIDQPSAAHDGAAPFAFADGHTEMHTWEASLSTPQARRVKMSNAVFAPAIAGDKDIHWVSYRAGRLTETSY